MALTPAEEASVRQLLSQSPQLLSLAGNEPAIIQELGAQDVTIQDLQLANSLLPTDKIIGRFGGEDKASLLSVLKLFINNGMATSAELAALLPKRVFQRNDFIRIPDAPGGLIINMIRNATSTTNEQGDATIAVNYPASMPNAVITSVFWPVIESGGTYPSTVACYGTTPGLSSAKVVIRGAGASRSCATSGIILGF